MTLLDYLLFDSCSPLATIDSFHHLTRSMRQLTDVADHVLALTGENVGLGNADKGAATETRKRKPDGMQVPAYCSRSVQESFGMRTPTALCSQPRRRG